VVYFCYNPDTVDDAEDVRSPPLGGGKTLVKSDSLSYHERAQQ
jgi:hypothetical protein